MNKPQLPSEEMNHFLEDVKEQIQYKPIRAEIEEELKAHIEDRTLEYIHMGIEGQEAAQKAVEQMGDGASIGIMMNKARHVKNSRLLIGMVLAAIMLGVLSNFIDYKVIWEYGILDGVSSIIFNLYYFIWGLIVLTIIYFKGYTFAVKHTKLLIGGFVGICLTERIFGILNAYGPHRYYSSRVLGYNWLLLLAPVLAVAAYKWRSKGKKVILLYSVFLLGMILLQYTSTRGFVLTGVLTIMITSMVTMFYMIHKGFITGNRKKLLVFSMVAFLTVIGLYGGVSFRDQETNFQLFIHPEQQAKDHWQDGYNGVLIKELLNKAELFGHIRLSSDELMNYETGAWYFDEGEVAEITHYLNYNESNVTLEEILPQHYHNNYRFACWILDYGWISAIILFAFVISLYAMLFIVTNKINNKLGHTLALCCSVSLLIQMILYLLGNLGYQYGSFTTLPFISEGLSSITTNMILVGLILSAYRYDNVIREENYLNKGIKVGRV